MDFVAKRRRLVECLVSEGYLRSRRVIDAMLGVPRELFVPEDARAGAYADCPMPIGFGQTISAPHMVALMTELLGLEDDSVVLEVGSGSGYQAAVIAAAAPDGFVYSVERIESLADFARDNLASCKIRNVEVVSGDGTLGYVRKAPYGRIIVTAAAPGVPESLLGQLSDGGRLLIPVGDRFLQDLVEVRNEGGKFVEKHHGGCVFVPLIGEEGWK
ncbi:MAG: protein-L-isoaspartate(D-aspartate) O-methyltransferase [Candidatus Altiarchaeota archaeon]|nr:protein-L-isoaspartate(D-aspartate) O-methyltransferase [Candidatus Altiarchaeota archaeon]